MFQKNDNRFKRWEIALALSLCLVYVQALAAGGVWAGWWGVIFPGLTEGAAAETAALGGGEGIELRFQILDWISSLFR